MLLKLAFLNLFRNKRRTFSTGLAVCVGLAGLNLVGSYIYQVKKVLDNTSVYSGLNGHVKIFKKDSLVQFSLKPKKYIIEKNEIEQIEDLLKKSKFEIDYVGQNLNGSGLLSNGKRSHPVLYFSFEPEIYAKSLSQPELIKWAKDWILPAQLENIDIFRHNNEVMSVTARIAEIMSLKMPLDSNEALQLAGRSFDGDLNAVNLELGASHTSGVQFLEDTLVLVPFKKAQELMGTEGAESLSIYLKSFDDFKDFKIFFDKEAEKFSFKLDTYFYYDNKINSVYEGTMGFMVVMGFFFVFLIGTAVSLTIVNSLTMGIIERTKEMGTLMAVGFKRRHIKDIFIYENLILTGFAILCGMFLSTFISAIVTRLDIRFTPPSVSLPVKFNLPWNGYMAFSIALFIFALTWASSAIVLNRKSKIKLIDLLNDTGA